MKWAMTRCSSRCGRATCVKYLFDKHLRLRVVTPRTSPELLEVWRQIAQEMLALGASLEEVCKRIGRDCQCANATVRGYLDPNYARRHVQAVLKYDRRIRELRRLSKLQSHDVVGESRYDGCEPEPHRLARPPPIWDCPDSRRKWRRQYFRLTRQPKRYLERVFRNDDEVTFDTIRTRLAELTDGTRFRPCTVSRLLKRYEVGQCEGSIRGPPYLQEVRPGVWRYGDEHPRDNALRAEPLAENR